MNGWKECYEERAAIMEYDGGLQRCDAEVLAAAIVEAAKQRQQPSKVVTYQTGSKQREKRSNAQRDAVAQMKKLLGKG